MIRIFIIGIFLFLSACQSTNTSNSDTESQLLTPAVFQELLDKYENEQLIDLRTPAEVNDGFIPNALFIDFKDKEIFYSKIEALDKNKPVMVYCASGGRSGKTAGILKKSGFTHIVDLDGGFTAWEKANLPIDHP